MNVEIKEVCSIELNKKHIYRAKVPPKKQEFWENDEFVRLKMKNFEQSNVVIISKDGDNCKGIFASNVPKVHQILPNIFVKTDRAKTSAVSTKKMWKANEVDFSVLVCKSPEKTFVFKRGVKLLRIDKKIALEIRQFEPKNPVFSVCNFCLRTTDSCFIVGKKTICKGCASFGDLDVGFMYRLDGKYYCQWGDEEIDTPKCSPYVKIIKGHNFITYFSQTQGWYYFDIDLNEHNIIYDEII